MKEKAVSLNVTPLSPIHIGGREQQLRGGVDFIFHQGHGKCYVIDEHKLIQELQKKEGLIERFIQEAETGEVRLGEFLQKYKSKSEYEQCLRSISVYSCPSPPTNTIRPFIRNAYAQPYIPGTALKGALRTAALYCFVKKFKDTSPFKETMIMEINKTLRDYRMPPEKKRKEVGSFLNDFFQNFELYYEGKKIDNTTPQETDLFRAIKISDSEPLDKDSLKIEGVRVVSLTSRNGWKLSKIRRGEMETQDPVRVYPECLLQGQIEFKVKIDTALLSQLQNPVGVGTSLKDFILQRAETRYPSEFHSELGLALAKTLVSLSQEFAEDILEEEKGFFDPLLPTPKDNLQRVKDFYDSQKPNLRLGWGGGMLGAGIFYLLKQGQASDVIERIARLFPQYHRPPHGNLPHGDQIFELFPKTRRVTVEGRNAVSPLGWAKLEIS
jgi:CRISPR-associated protein Csm5